jgi:hypothetical protein
MHIASAEGIASSIFAGIGLKVEWQRGSCSPNALTVTLTVNTPADFMPGAVAYTEPPDPSRVRVFCDRVSDPSNFNQYAIPRILGHVLAHEIGHMLQGVAHHSATGVMKAKWTPADFEEMTSHRLQFTPEDVRLIRAGLPRQNQCARAARIESA